MKIDIDLFKIFKQKKQKLEAKRQEMLEDINIAEEKSRQKIQAAEEKSRQKIQAAEEESRQKIQAAEEESRQKIQAAEEESRQKIQAAEEESRQKIQAAMAENQYKNQVEEMAKQTQCYCPYHSEKKQSFDENEKIAVYETLRNEIISTQGMRTNLIVYMFSVYFLVFGYGVGNGQSHRYCFVVSYFVLLAFQTKIIRLKYTIARISYFISKYFEPEKEEYLYKWESINLDNDFLRTKNWFFTFLSSSGAFILGLLSIAAFGYYTYEEHHKCICMWPGFDQFLFGVCIVGLIFLIWIRDDYKVDKKDKERIAKQLDDIEGKFNKNKETKQ